MPVQFYKQHNDGALDVDGEPMDRGWYWLWISDAPRAYGYEKSVGPFKTKREAMRNYDNYEPPTGHIADEPDFPGFADDH